MSTLLFWLVMGLIICFAVTNGFLDGGGIVSTVITTRTLNPLPALVLVALCEVGGLLLLGQAVAHTVGIRLLLLPYTLSPHKVMVVLICAVSAALAWNLTMWRFSLPSSSSHALIGGLLGAAWAGYGTSAIHWPTAIWVLIFLGLGPWIAAGASFLLMKTAGHLGEWLSPAVLGVVRSVQAMILGGMAMAHGSMDGQKSLALMWLVSSAIGPLALQIPVSSTLYVYFCGGALALGVILGSHRTLRTVGRELYKVQPLQSLCAETTAMSLIAASSLLGWPMASSHVVSSSVIGAGAAVHPKSIRWPVAGDIVKAWVLTIPTAALASGILFTILRSMFHVVS